MDLATYNLAQSYRDCFWKEFNLERLEDIVTEDVTFKYLSEGEIIYSCGNREEYLSLMNERFFSTVDLESTRIKRFETLPKPDLNGFNVSYDLSQIHIIDGKLVELLIGMDEDLTLRDGKICKIFFTRRYYKKNTDSS